VNQVADRALPRLRGLHTGQVSIFTHPRGWFSIDLPKPWSVAQQAESSLAINPGFTPSDTLDALVVIAYGELDTDQARIDIADLFESVRPSVLQDLASQGIEVQDGRSRARRVALAHATGVIQLWKGKAGERDVVVWFGGLTSGGYYLTVTAAVLADKVRRFLPGAKRILYSAQPRPPQRDPAVERELEDAEFSALETRPGGSRGSFSTILQFRTGNSVKRTIIISGTVGVMTDVGGSSEEWGTYQVIGDEVRLSFSGSQDALTIAVEQGHIVALEREGRTYSRR
jgi:hypothetical protein